MKADEYSLENKCWMSFSVRNKMKTGKEGILSFACPAGLVEL